MALLRFKLDRSELVEAKLTLETYTTSTPTSISFSLLTAEKFFNLSGDLTPEEFLIPVSDFSENSLTIPVTVFSQVQEFDQIEIRLFSDKSVIFDWVLNWPELIGQSQVEVFLENNNDEPQLDSPPEVRAEIRTNQREVFSGEVITLDGANSTISHGTLIFEWKQISGAPVDLPLVSTPVLEFVAPDIEGLSDKVEIKLKVHDENSISENEITETITIKKKIEQPSPDPTEGTVEEGEVSIGSTDETEGLTEEAERPETERERKNKSNSYFFPVLVVLAAVCITAFSMYLWKPEPFNDLYVKLTKKCSVAVVVSEIASAKASQGLEIRTSSSFSKCENGLLPSLMSEGNTDADVALEIAKLYDEAISQSLLSSFGFNPSKDAQIAIGYYGKAARGGSKEASEILNRKCDAATTRLEKALFNSACEQIQ